MKKSLLLTALLTGAAVADDAIGSSNKYDDDSIYVSYESLASIGNGGVITVLSHHGTADISMKAPSYTCMDTSNGTSTPTSYIGQTNAVDVNIGTGGSFQSTYTFPVSSATSETYTVSNVSFTFGLNTDAGTAYTLDDYLEANGGSAPKFSLTLTVKDVAGNIKGSQEATFTYQKVNNSYIYTMGFDFNSGTSYPSYGLELTGDLILEVSVAGITTSASAAATQAEDYVAKGIATLNDETSADTTEGSTPPPSIGAAPTMPDGSFYVSIDTIKIVGKAPANVNIPEPTTATLSLLALAGLAARRRRK